MHWQIAFSQIILLGLNEVLVSWDFATWVRIIFFFLQLRKKG